MDSDQDFYCYLKARLTPPYSIIAEPSTSYYSEWQFDYRVFRGDELVHRCSGDFRDIEPGELVRAAEEILSRARTDHADR